MSAARPQSSRSPATLWVSQMIGTLAIAAAILFFFSSRAPASTADTLWPAIALSAALVACAPSLFYLPRFRARLNADVAALRRAGAPDPATRQVLYSSLAIGGALCDLPQALGLLALFLGAETRWFLAATAATIAMRIAYRPFAGTPH